MSKRIMKRNGSRRSFGSHSHLVHIVLSLIHQKLCSSRYLGSHPDIPVFFPQDFLFVEHSYFEAFETVMKKLLREGEVVADCIPSQLQLESWAFPSSSPVVEEGFRKAKKYLHDLLKHLTLFPRLGQVIKAKFVY